MAQYSYPGVYIKEIPTNPSITGASTNTTVLIGVTEMGAPAAGDPPEPVLINGWDSFTNQFGGFLWNQNLPYAVYSYFNEGGSVLYVVSVGTNTAGKIAKATVEGIAFSASSPGLWGNDLSIVITPNGTTSFGITVAYQPPTKVPKGGFPAYTQLLQAYIKQNNIPLTDGYYALESYAGLGLADVTVTNGSSPLTTKLTNSLFVRASLQSSLSAIPKQAGPTPLTGGSDPVYGWQAAIDAIETVDGVALAAIPDSVNISSNDMLPTLNQMLSLAETDMNFFAVVDPPFGQTVSEVVAFKQGGNGGNSLSSSYGAMYYPWIWFVLPQNGMLTPMPPSGAVLGRYVATDNDVGVWKAPAGTSDGSLLLAARVNTNVSNTDQETLNPAGVNAIRSFATYGILIWGCRTFSPEQQWVYVNVRRLFIYIEQSIDQSLKWVVFEPNSPGLWALVTRDVTAFLTQLWHEGALFGASANDAFFVTCDASNNPPANMEAGILTVDIGVAAVRPAEFVVLRFSQKTLT